MSDQSSRKMPAWLDDAVFYEIYPQSFLDTNNDGIGDIPGIISKLDYIKDLGCNAIWLNPLYDSPFLDAGYDVRDHKLVAPRYGTNEDLFTLFREAHRRDMHIILDLVPGHTSIDHPWFLEACRPEPNEYSERFIFTHSVWDLPPGYRWVSGYAQRDGNFMVNFFSTQPAINYGFQNITHPDWQKPPDHPDCLSSKEAMIDVMRYWLDHGADGFRVDMADSMIKNDDDKTGTSAFWQPVREMLDNDYPEAVIVSEWCNPVRAIKDAGFHMDFTLDHRHTGYHSLVRSRTAYDDSSAGENNCYVSSSGLGDITRFTNDFMAKLESIKDSSGYISLITCNHDTPRLTRYLSINEIKLAYAIIFTLPGVPFLYYGDEIGMAFIEGLHSKEGGYSRTGTRTPMQWNRGPNLGFSAAGPGKLYLPVDSSPDAPVVETQPDDPGSMLNTVKRLLALRHGSGDFKAGAPLEILHAHSGDPLFVYRRGSYFMLVNPSLRDVCYTLPESSGDYRCACQIGNVNIENNHVTLSSQSFAAICANE